MKILVAVGALGGNHVGRAYCLWLLSRELGWTTKVIGEGALWTVADDPEFQRDCVRGDDFLHWATWCDVLIPYAVFPETYGVARTSSRPVVVDVDEPHWEQRYGFTRTVNVKVAVYRALTGKRPLYPFAIRRDLRRRAIPVMVSNPSLLSLYPGSTVIPHVRPDDMYRPMPPGSPRVAFVGTPRAHKGIDLLRAAARAAGVELVITADPPEEPSPNESWVGRVPATRGRAILESSHAAAVLSDFSAFSSQQLPVKAIDAMMTGRVVVASPTEPLRWALGDAGLFSDLDVGSVTAALERLHDVADRERLARLSFERGSEAFTPRVVAPLFAEVLHEAAR